MANELQRHDSGGFLKSLDRFIQDSGLQDVKTRMDSRKGTAIIAGSRDGIQYTTTVQRNKYGATRTVSQYDTNIGRDAMIEQVKELRRQRYTQQEIADMLGISQATVSIYLRK
jgi:CRP-like cAMP-binding protein